MNLSTQDQANAVYYLFKVRRDAFSENVSKTDIRKVDTLHEEWRSLMGIAAEFERLQNIANEERIISK